MKSFHKKLAVIIFVVAAAIFLLYYFGIAGYVTPGNIKQNASYLKALVQERYATSVIIFTLGSAALMLLTLPLTGPIAVFGGFLFGLWAGVLYTMVGVIVGIALSFLIVRYALSHVVRNKYSEQLAAFNTRMREYGYTYLISLQLLTVVPYFIINTLAALAGVPFHTFIWTTIVGSLPIVIIYAFAGRQLYMIRSWSDILSMNMLLLLLGLAVIALLPMLIRKFKKVDTE
jgi:uncharacterized membrane protein YdjX (TVP38/TMEM64 family)